jgi:hypothetical protein
MIYKVISDNGYKLELIRPMRGDVISLGQTVEVSPKHSPCDLVKLFDGLLDEDTKNLIFDKFNEAKADVKT